MKNKLIRNSIILTLIFTLSSFDIPEGWLKAGNKPKSYEMGIAIAQGQDGKNTATIRSIEKKIYGFGTLMQQCKPDKYLGKRVRMTAYVRSENVTDWAGLWFRVNQAGSQQPLSFDNMQNRAIKGTTDWTKYEIVLDVPNNASMLVYGALISGEGQIWFDQLKFEIVDESVKSTAIALNGKSHILSEPSNLDFEK